jgi:hypothetical protein
MSLAFRRGPAAAVAALVATALLSGCGPKIPLDATLHQSDTNIQLGGRKPAPPTPAPLVPALNPVPNFPSLAVPMPPQVAIALPSALPSLPVQCPTADARTVPAEPAPPTATTPPAALTYAFRYSGTDTVTDKSSGKQTVTTLPPTGVRRVANVSPPASGGSYTFDVQELYNQYEVSVTYLVRPNGPASSLIAGDQQGAGLYLQEVQRKQLGTTSSDDFRPQPQVLLMPFPAQAGTQFQGGGTSPLDQSAMVIPPQGGTVKGEARVDACGTMLDAIEADVKGQWVQAPSNATKQFELDFSLGTQFGGLVLSDHYIESGTDDKTGNAYVLDVTSTISSAPQHAAAS